MNDVVSYSWMLRLLAKQRFQYGPRLELFGIGLVSRISRNRERKRVEDRSLRIFRVARREPRHRVTIRVQPNRLGCGFERFVEAGSGIHVVALALRVRLGRFGRLNSLTALIEKVARLQSGSKGVAPTAQRNTPVGHGAARVDRKSRPESRDCRTKLK